MDKQLSEQRKETVFAINSFPYFVLRNIADIGSGYSDYTKHVREIATYYADYKKGAMFTPNGTNGDYIPSVVRFKIMARLINKEARFMFSQQPDIKIVGKNEDDKDKIEQYQVAIDKVLKKSKFQKKLLQSAKDCFIGGRVAGLVEYSETKGVLISFYTALQFYYETEYDSDELTRFITFKNIAKSENKSGRTFLVNDYKKDQDGVSMSSALYDGSGNVLETLISEHDIQLQSIPAVIITNDGTLDETEGVSEIEELAESEAAYSKLSNADIDCDSSGMNPVKYAIDMNHETTKELSVRPGSFWDVEHNQNMDDPKPSLGVLSPNMQHTDATKATLDRIKADMYDALDIPNISEETLVGTITSGKSMEALYYALSVRCDEKMRTWEPAIEQLIEYTIMFLKLNRTQAVQLYGITGIDDVLYTINVEKNYALIKDETEEKNMDLQEVSQGARSRLSYLTKWRAEDLTTDNKRMEELLQVAEEENMLDTMSMNTQVQSRLEQRTTEEELDNILGSETSQE